MRFVFGLSFAALLTLANSAWSFSLHGPFESWQTDAIGYQIETEDAGDEIGGPMNLGEEYRWNVKVITYGFDPSFVNYFGKKGMDEIRKGMNVFNALPSFSKMSANLNEYPMDPRRRNLRAQSLFLYDLKSKAMAAVIEELGLGNPYDYVWALRDKVALQPDGFSYQVIMRNFDPATALPSRHINGTMYSYIVLDPVPDFDVDFADAVDYSVDPLSPRPTAVAASFSKYSFHKSQIYGDFFVGLSRDDVGGLRYLYSKNNKNIETLPPGTLGSVGGGAWAPVSGTNTLVDSALRPGIDKIVFQELKFDSGGYGGFTARTNRGTDVYILNNRQIKQGIARPLELPDIVFAASDQNRSLLFRTDTTGWINNAATNSPGGSGEVTISGGPGTIVPPVVITFNKVGPSFINQYSGNSFSMDESSGSPFFLWASFDGSTNTPFIYPPDINGNSYPIEELEQVIYGGVLTTIP